MEHRKHARYLVEYSAAFSGDNITGQGVILDISTLGCRARSTIAVQKGDFVGLLIDIPAQPMPLHVALAVVRWTREQEFGVEFIRMQPKDQQQLRQVIYGAEARNKELPAAVTGFQQQPGHT